MDTKHSLSEHIQSALDERKQNALWRKIKTAQTRQTVKMDFEGKQYRVFCSNNYLGLSNHPSVISAFKKGVEQFGVGAGASHLITGHQQPHQALQEAISDWLGRDRTMLFSTGYMANLAAISTLVSREDLVVQDKLNHASLIDGALLSRATLKRYQHQDMNHAARLLQGGFRHRLLVSDGVFSMDGDQAKLKQLTQIAQQTDSTLMIDDAHGLGVLGETGGGLIEMGGFNQTDAPILVGTFGKAFGTAGAFISGNEDLIEYLTQFARPYIYTTACPPAIATATQASLKIIRERNDLRQHLQNLIRAFRAGATQLSLKLMPSDTAIQPIVIGDELKAAAWSEALADKGILIAAIRHPTVPKGQARLRVTLSAEHQLEDVDYLLSTLAEILQSVKSPK